MVLCHLLIFILTLNDLLAFVECTGCRPGQKMSRDNGHCEPCDGGYYQPTENASKSCKACTRCRDGSSVEEPCTKTTDTKCQCRKGFVPLFPHSEICQCEKGSGLVGREPHTVCSKCEDGYFSAQTNTYCKRWKDCKTTGEKTRGTSTSDVICNELKDGPQIKDATTSKITTLLSNSTTLRPHEGAQTAHFTTTSTKPPQEHTEETPPSHGNYLGMSLLLFGIAGLLMLTAVTCKLFITPCYKRRSTRNQKECRIPVEESGSEESYKLSLEP
ncbi:tumor necrosis factor receptor superfamily member 4 [Cololabis saira]|uniref:tumor necrosis factor receptor superfamily member 4 n=1 Tax=Cololabis saira TaxID=129043 RepID=UPI002AD3D34A|nr:tumor necrosis factor receptor superfamily member 4 [Cololabis saira]